MRRTLSPKLHLISSHPYQATAHLPQPFMCSRLTDPLVDGELLRAPPRHSLQKRRQRCECEVCREDAVALMTPLPTSHDSSSVCWLTWRRRFAFVVECVVSISQVLWKAMNYRDLINHYWTISIQVCSKVKKVFLPKIREPRVLFPYSLHVHDWKACFVT